jgi:hypothetical protein
VITHAEEILSLFGVNKKSAIQQYNQFMQQDLKDKADFEGGGLKRSLGDSLYALNCRSSESNGVDQLYYQRILGLGQFVEGVQNQKETKSCDVIGYDDLKGRYVRTITLPKQTSVVFERKRRVYRRKYLSILRSIIVRI